MVLRRSIRRLGPNKFALFLKGKQLGSFVFKTKEAARKFLKKYS